MPKIDKRGRPRLKKLPNERTIRERGYLAMKGKPSPQKRKDLLLVIWLYTNKLRLGGHAAYAKAIMAWKERLKIFDEGYYKQKAQVRMNSRKHGVKGKGYEEQIKAVVDVLNDGGNVEGFTYIRTAKAPKSRTHFPLISSEELDTIPAGMSLCIVRVQSGR